MPRGGARTGAGRKPKAVALHLLQGTLRPARHASALAAAAAPPVAGWAPTDAERSALGDAGRAVVDRVLGVYEPSVVEGLQLLEAAKAADTLAALRAAPEPDRRQIRLWSMFYTATLRMLGLTS